MQIINASANEGAIAIARRLSELLHNGKKVLWLVSGGSNLQLQVDVMAQLDAADTANLTVMPVDERYGPVGYANSNIKQMKDLGFDPKQGTFVDLLTGASIEETTETFAQTFNKTSQEAEAVVAQLGMGPDGHIAGLIPGSPAIEATGLATHYQGADFPRMTLTFEALKRITDTYLLAYGESKKPQLVDLLTKDLPVAQQPAQFLKTLPNVYLYNDQVSEGVAA